MGFPRSGTTLIEQVLASHSAVRAGGELSFVSELRQFSLQQFAGPESFPDNLARTWTADNRWAATLFRDYYFARAEQYGLLAPGKRYFTDKMPFNEIWLPLRAHGVPAREDRARAAPSAGRLRVHAREQHDARLQLRLSDRGHRASSAGRVRSGRALRARARCRRSSSCTTSASSPSNAARPHGCSIISGSRSSRRA